jgi:hypothetical protein
MAVIRVDSSLEKGVCHVKLAPETSTAAIREDVRNIGQRVRVWHDICIELPIVNN